MRRIALLIGLLSLSSLLGQPQTLFNGRDLDGWKGFLVDPSVKTEQVWSVYDGILTCLGQPLGYLHTERSFTNFRLIVEWRWAPGAEPGNSGVLMRINGPQKGIPRSIEAQLRSGNAGDVFGFHGMKLDGPADRKRGGENHELLGDFVGIGKILAAENPPGQWNQYEIVLDGPDLTVRVNGQLVNRVTDCTVVEGPIGLQSEGGVIQFRRVELEELP